MLCLVRSLALLQVAQLGQLSGELWGTSLGNPTLGSNMESAFRQYLRPILLLMVLGTGALLLILFKRSFVMQYSVSAYQYLLFAYGGIAIALAIIAYRNKLRK